jgi:hypothetical protein
VQIFLAQSDEWRREAEPKLTEQHNAATVVLPAGTASRVRYEPRSASRYRCSRAQADRKASKAPGDVCRAR